MQTPNARIVAAALFASTAATAAPASDWRMIARDAEVVHYVDAGSVARAGSTVLFMGQMVYLVPMRLEAGIEVERALVRREADCETMQGRIVQITLYLADNRFDSWLDESPAEPAATGSAADALYRAACTRSFGGPSIADPPAHAAALRRAG